MKDKLGKTSQRTNKLRDEQIFGWTHSGDKGCITAPVKCCSRYRYFLFNSFPNDKF